MPSHPDIRLIAVDMDGTLLDGAKALSPHFWDLADALAERGILFCPASGRQYHALYRQFGDHADSLTYIAENGAYVVEGTREISATTLDEALVMRILDAIDAVEGRDLGVVVCGKDSAYIERDDAEFRAQADQYYAHLAVVEDLRERPADGILKVAIYDFGAAEQLAQSLSELAGETQVVVSGEHWVDVMHPETNKGRGLVALQQAHGITPAQTMAFGDYLNDLELMDHAEHSYAMANAHPGLKERARFEAPSNEDDGVVRTISRVLGLPWV